MCGYLFHATDRCFEAKFSNWNEHLTFAVAGFVFTCEPTKLLDRESAYK